MDIRLLGPVTASMPPGSRPVGLGPPKQRLVFAALALTPGHPVPLDVLVDRVWDEAPPSDIRAALYSYLTRLRRSLEPTLHIRRRAGGYVLDAAPDDVDLVRFHRLVASARRDAATSPATAADRVREAIDMWEGRPLADLNGPWVERTQYALQQQRHEVLVDLVDLELGLGRQSTVVHELPVWIEEFPLSEPLVERHLRILMQLGRRAEALDAYARTKALLTDELGEDPGSALQDLHLRILRHDPTLELASPPPRPTACSVGAELRPRQLPPSPSAFVGRQGELDTALGAFAGERSAVMTVAIYGQGGVGKSSLALRIAHEVCDAYPDGQLYLDLQGASPGSTPLTPLAALGRMLRALGVDPTAIPSGTDEATALFRSLTANRRMLVLLDNARDIAQIRPLLPAGTACATLITSRPALTTLDSAAQIRLDELTPAAAVALLTAADTSGRCRSAPALSARLAQLCGHLPLALRITAARILARPDWPLDVFVDRLADRRLRLDQLGHADLDVRACFDVTYRALCEDDLAAARAFRLMAISEGPDLSLPVAARLLDLDEPSTAAILDRLLDAQMLQSRTPGRSHMHDLVRDYAREVAHRDEPEEQRRAALVRAWQCWTATAAIAADLCRPSKRRNRSLGVDWKDGLGLADQKAASTWLDQEYDNLRAAARQADQLGAAQQRITMDIALVLQWFCSVRGRFEDAGELALRAIDLARSGHEYVLEAYLTDNIGLHRTYQGRHHEAFELHARAAALYRDSADRIGEAAALTNMGLSTLGQGAFHRAIALLETALSTRRGLEDRHGEAANLVNLATAHYWLGRFDTAIGLYEAALEVCRAARNPHIEAIAMADLADALAMAGRPAEATDLAEQALAIQRELGDHHGQALAVVALARVALQANRMDDAAALAAAALDHSRAARSLALELCGLDLLAEALHRLGRHEEAEKQAARCLEIARLYGFPHYEALATWRLGASLAATGRAAHGGRLLRSAYDQLRTLDLPAATRLEAHLTAEQPPTTAG